MGIEEDISDLQSEISGHSDDFVDLRDRIDAVEKEQARMRSLDEDMERRAGMSVERIDRLEDQLKRLALLTINPRR